MQFTEIKDASYINLETFYPSGKGVKTPVWNVFADGKIYVWTDLESYKVKRIQGNPTVRLCASDPGGTPKSDWIEAQALVQEDDGAVRALKKRMAKKYHLMYWLFYWMGRLRGANNVTIEIWQPENPEPKI